MRPETPRVGEGRLLRLWRARRMQAREMVPGAFLGLRCADAGHLPGLFAE